MRVLEMEEVKYVPTTQNTDNGIKLNPEPTKTKPDTAFLRFTVLTGMLVLMHEFAVIVWSSPALIILKTNNTDVNPIGRPITTKEISSMVGLPALAAFAGTFLSKLADIIGRKRSLQVIGLGMFLSTLALAFSRHIILIIMFKTISEGLGYGTLNILSIYITEICEDHNRSKYCSLVMVGLPMGQLYTYAMGTAFGYTTFTLITAALLIPFLIGYMFVPESPVYLMSKSRSDDCFIALKKLRSNKSAKELERDRSDIKQSLIINQDGIISKFGIIQLLSTKKGRLSVIFSLLPSLAQSMCGIPIMMSLLAPIFDVPGSNFSGNLVSVIVGVCKLFSFMTVSSIIQKTGKIRLLVLSATGIGLFMSILGAIFFAIHIEVLSVSVMQGSISVICLVLCVIFYSLGLGPVPFSILAEWFPPDLRSTGLVFSTVITILVYSPYPFLFPILSEKIGIYSCIWIFAISSGLFAIIFSVFMPDTKDKSIIEIQEILEEYKLLKR